MDLKLYGICFKLRGGPDFLEYVQTNTPVPVDLMTQMVQEMESVTKEELRFAALMESDWKKGFSERVPLLMQIGETGGYEISCTVPDELLSVTRILTGLSDEKIVEEYTANHLKTVCGVDAQIVSVDVEPEEEPKKAEVLTENAGFDLGDLNAEPELPPFEPVEDYADLVEEPIKEDAPAYTPKAKELEMEAGFDADDLTEEPDVLMEMSAGTDEAKEDASYPDLDEAYEELPEEEPDEYDEPPEEEPDEYDEPPEEDLEEDEEDEEAGMESRGQAISRVYKEMVDNIRERGLDEKLNLRIG